MAATLPSAQCVEATYNEDVATVTSMTVTRICAAMAEARVRALVMDTEAVKISVSPANMVAMYDVVGMHWILKFNFVPGRRWLSSVFDDLIRHVLPLGWMPCWSDTDSHQVLVMSVGDANVGEKLAFFADKLPSTLLDEVLDALWAVNNAAPDILERWQRKQAKHGCFTAFVEQLTSHRLYRTAPSALRSEFLWACVCAQ
jgi:hypothetical protein